MRKEAINADRLGSERSPLRGTTSAWGRCWISLTLMGSSAEARKAAGVGWGGAHRSHHFVHICMVHVCFVHHFCVNVLVVSLTKWCARVRACVCVRV